MEWLKIEFEYEWKPVLAEDGKEYRFPEERTEFMKMYKRPAVYRWNVSRPDDRRKVYIGEAKDLYRRIYGYLKPGRTQETNKRINTLFNNYLSQGYTIRLEVLQVDNVRVAGVTFTANDLSNKYIRTLFESLMITVHEQNRVELLNKQVETKKENHDARP